MEKRILLVPLILAFVVVGIANGLQIESQHYDLLPGDEINRTLTFYNENDEPQNFTVALVSSNETYLSCVFDNDSTEMEINLDEGDDTDETIFMRVNGSAPSGDYRCDVELDIEAEIEVGIVESVSNGNKTITFTENVSSTVAKTCVIKRIDAWIDDVKAVVRRAASE